MEVAKVMSKRSTCMRGRVGAVATIEGRIVAVGYNGSLSGSPHCTSQTCNDSAPCSNTVHAEANLIAFCARKGISLEGGTLYITHSPCETCAKLIVQAGFLKVYYEKPYRVTHNLFEEHGIVCEQLFESYLPSNILD